MVKDITVREKIQLILEKHKDKDAETLAAMIYAYLAADEVVRDEWAYVIQDERYYDREAGCRNDQLDKDYNDIGLDLLF